MTGILVYNGVASINYKCWLVCRIYSPWLWVRDQFVIRYMWVSRVVKAEYDAGATIDNARVRGRMNGASCQHLNKLDVATLALPEPTDFPLHTFIIVFTFFMYFSMPLRIWVTASKKAACVSCEWKWTESGVSARSALRDGKPRCSRSGIYTTATRSSSK